MAAGPGIALVAGLVGLVPSGGAESMAGLMAVAAASSTAGALVARRRLTAHASNHPVHAGSWDPRSLIVQELERSRRYERAFTLLRLPGHAPAGSLESALRRGDVSWWEDDHTVVLMPELTREQAEMAVERMARAEVPGLAFDRARLASFPADALTLAGLYDCVRGQAQVGAKRHENGSRGRS